MACNKISPLGEWLRKAYKNLNQMHTSTAQMPPVRESIIHLRLRRTGVLYPTWKNTFRRLRMPSPAMIQLGRTFKSILNDTMAYCYPKKLGRRTTSSLHDSQT